MEDDVGEIICWWFPRINLHFLLDPTQSLECVVPKRKNTWFFFPIFQKEKKTFLVVSLCGITKLEQNQGRQNLVFKSNSLFETTLLNLNYKIRLTLTDCFRVIERLVLGSNIRRFQFVQIVFLNKLRSIIVFFKEKLVMKVTWSQKGDKLNIL